MKCGNRTPFVGVLLTVDLALRGPLAAGMFVSAAPDVVRNGSGALTDRAQS